MFPPIYVLYLNHELNIQETKEQMTSCKKVCPTGELLLHSSVIAKTAKRHTKLYYKKSI
jgi:hypothetical protein